MRQSRFTEEQIIGVLKQAEAGMKTAEICRQHGISSGDVLQVEGEVRGLRGQRGAAAAAVGRRESAAEADRGGPDAGQPSLEDGAGKKVLAPTDRREAVGVIRQAHGLSERRACRLVGLARTSCRYERQRQGEEEKLKARLHSLAGERRRFGYRRLTVLLRREGWAVNHKRVYRLYREEGLGVRRRKRKRIGAVERQAAGDPDPAERALVDGFYFRCAE